jgi:hypothetical protein
MNLKHRMCVDQGDYESPKKKYYKWLTFLSNGIILYLQESTNMIHLKQFLQNSKLICRKFQPVVKCVEQLPSFLLARSFQNICARL